MGETGLVCSGDEVIVWTGLLDRKVFGATITTFVTGLAVVKVFDVTGPALPGTDGVIPKMVGFTTGAAVAEEGSGMLSSLSVITRTSPAVGTIVDTVSTGTSSCCSRGGGDGMTFIGTEEEVEEEGVGAMFGSLPLSSSRVATGCCVVVVTADGESGGGVDSLPLFGVIRLVGFSCCCIGSDSCGTKDGMSLLLSLPLPPESSEDTVGNVPLGCCCCWLNGLDVDGLCTVVGADTEG